MRLQGCHDSFLPSPCKVTFRLSGQLPRGITPQELVNPFDEACFAFLLQAACVCFSKLLNLYSSEQIERPDSP